MSEVRFATFNIKHGSRDDDRVDNSGLVDACARLDADVLALQEVDRRRARSRFRDQAAMVARRLGYRHVFGAVRSRGAHGQYGNALLVRGALSEVEVLGLPRPSPRQARGAILARVSLRSGACTVAVTHLQHQPRGGGHLPPEAPVQLRALLAALAARPGPRMVLGDLNLGLPQAEPLLVEAGFHLAGRALTFPADDPRVKLDYVALDDAADARESTVVSGVSDHCALVAAITADWAGDRSPDAPGTSDGLAVRPG